jgi:uncharacterized protein (TIGR00730 family)
MRDIRAIAAFCGSKTGENPAFSKAARALGTAMAGRGIRLVFGGGRIGIMGVLADAVLAQGGEATGVIPDFLTELEVGHEKVTELVRVKSMHERKARMFAEADAFVVLPGGLGTLDEALEVITWKQLRLHDKPIVLLDTAGYWAPLAALVEATIEGGFAHPKVLDLFTRVARVEDVFRAIENAPEPSREVLESHL